MVKSSRHDQSVNRTPKSCTFGFHSRRFDAVTTNVMRNIPMPIVINSIEYQCWHEVGHATTCLHLGGDVEFVELVDDETVGGLARTCCTTTPEIRSSVACGGFAAEYFLLRKGHLEQVNEKEITQIIFINASKDREMFLGRKLSDGEGFSKEIDQTFMNHAVYIVAPIFNGYFTGMKEIVRELVRVKKVDGRRIKDILFCR